MIFQTSVRIECPVERAYEVFADVERWPSWTASVTSVELLDGPLRVGARARIRQPRLPTAVWQVTELEEGRQFTWESRAPGILTIGRHLVQPAAGGTLARSILEQHGPLGQVVGQLYAGLTRRYLAMEAAGLKSAAEGSGS